METNENQYRVELKAVDELQPYARNARTHGRDQIEQIKGLIRLVGFTNPLLVDGQGIIAGHGRQIAVQELWAEGETVMGPGKRFALPPGMVPTIDGSGMSETERRAYILADNQVALNSDWDRKLLAGELQALKALDFRMDALGFDTSQLVQFMATPRQPADPELVPPVEALAVTQPGWVWQLGQHRIVCGDCTDAAVVQLVLDEQAPVLMVTDPPYGVNYDPAWRRSDDSRKPDIDGGKTYNRSVGIVANDDRADWREAYALFTGAVAYVWHGGLFGGIVQDGLASAGLEVRTQIIWAKPHYAISRGDYHVQHEPCFYAVRKGKAGGWQGGRKQSTVWQIANGTFQGGKKGPEDARTGHGTQKPVECMKRPIENNSKAGQAVYDPFLGSGTTLIAAEMTHRVALCCELNPLYVDVAVKRWQAFTGEAATLAGDGRTFDAIAK